VSDIDTAAADSLKVLDPKRPIREADIDEGTLSFRPDDHCPVNSVAILCTCDTDPLRAVQQQIGAMPGPN
jgi:hypothetical protein